MVFGLFSRKPAAAPPQPLATDSNSKPIPDIDSTNAHLHGLRTPSPSVAGFGASNSPELSVTTRNLAAPFPTSTPPADLMQIETEADPAALYALLQSIPPKIMHEYILTHLAPSLPLPPTSPQTQAPLPPLVLTVLTSFFSALTPPPLLHCARCHAGFFEVENNDRSCTVAHDDDSAEVERVSRTSRLNVGGEGGGARYETLWGCCGRTVEGDGDMGPPDGWCYEGKHTTDPKRARFRADSTIHDDKLFSCARVRCPHAPFVRALHPHATLPPASASGSTSSASESSHTHKRNPRKRTREESASGDEEDHDHEMTEIKNMREEEEESASASGSSSTGDVITVMKQKPALPTPKRPTPARGRRLTPKATGKGKGRAHEDESGNERQRSTARPTRSRPRPRPVSRAPAASPATKKPTPTKPTSRAQSTPATPRRLTRLGVSMGEVADSEEERVKRRKVA